MKHKYWFLIFILAVFSGGFYFFFTAKEPDKVVIKNMEVDISSGSSEGVDKTEQAQQEGIISQPVLEKPDKETLSEEVENSLPSKREKEESPAKDNLKVTDKLVSWGYEIAKNRPIDTIVIHSSYDAIGADPYSVSGILKEYKDYGVSAHYLINREGNIYKLVEEKNIAYHAGESRVPDGRTGVNKFSVGIELVNTKTDQCTSLQYEALKKLIADIKARNNIKYLVGHNEIAPGRKDDPWGFEWSKAR